jgi:hypothetical protein
LPQLGQRTFFPTAVSGAFKITSQRVQTTSTGISVPQFFTFYPQALARQALLYAGIAGLQLTASGNSQPAGMQNAGLSQLFTFLA